MKCTKKLAAELNAVMLKPGYQTEGLCVLDYLDKHNVSMSDFALVTSLDKSRWRLTCTCDDCTFEGVMGKLEGRG